MEQSGLNQVELYDENARKQVLSSSALMHSLSLCRPKHSQFLSAIACSGLFRIGFYVIKESKVSSG